MSERDAETQKLALEAAAPSGSRKLYWFLDGELVTAGERAQVAYVTPTPGPHVLRCMDEAGHADLVRFTVVAD